MSEQRLGCVKTRAYCGAVEWRSQASNVLCSGAERRASRDAETQKSRKLNKGHILRFMLLCVERRGDLEAYGNRVLTIWH